MIARCHGALFPMTSEFSPAGASPVWLSMRDSIDVKRTQASVLHRMFGHELEPTRIGRFTVLGTAGEGAMGRVYAAHDPELDRRVAIKLIRDFDPDPDLAERQRSRLVREARAMAKVQHPNVIAVHEVLSHDEDVFVVMEYVDGPSLRTFIGERERPWREVVRVFAGAGRGLVAAHARDLVHRDFKPDNVLVGSGMRAIVLDFGLARPPVRDASLETFESRKHDAVSPATAAAGTPAYMAPEQIMGVAADARSDQFSYCVALFEALHGTRPFAADDGEARLELIRRGTLPSARRVPNWLSRVIARGLAYERADRWPTMRALVRELERRRVTAPLLGLGAATTLAVAGFGAALAQWADDDAIRCDQGRARVGDVWDYAARRAVVQSIGGAKPAYAPALASRLAGRLDVYAVEWARGYDDACAATHVRGEQSDAVLDQRMGCLSRRLAGFRAAVALLAEPSAALIKRAPRLVGGLAAVDECEDMELLGADVPLPADPDVREEIERAEALIAQAGAQRLAGDYVEAEAAVAAAEELERARSYGPLEARRLFSRGLLLVDQDDPGAERVLLDAVAVAETHRQDALAASCWRALVRATEGDREADRRAEGYLERLAAAVGRIGSPARHSGHLERARGMVARRATRYEDQARHLQQAIALLSLDSGGASRVADVRVDLAGAWFLLGRYAQAAEEFGAAAEIQAEVYGPDHPFTARTLGNRGTALVALGRNREAIEALGQARAAIRRGLGRDDPSVAMTTNAMASAHYQLGEFESARDLYAEAIRVYEASLSPGDARIGSPLANLARCQSHLGLHDEAIASGRRAVALLIAARGPDHIEVATAYAAVAHASTRAELFEDALVANGEALRIRTAELGEGHVETAYSQQAMADSLRVAGRHDESLQLAEAARMTLQRELGPEHPQLASVLLTVARTERALGRRRAAADHLRRALSIYQSAEASPDDVEQVRRALDEVETLPE